MLYWVTGLAGSGKSSFAALLHTDLKRLTKNVVLLDGDSLRDAISQDLGYTPEDRLKSAYRNARLCRLIESQGINVICSTISMFHAVRQWNREHITSYTEIYIKVPFEVLRERDQKQLYSEQSKGKTQHVVGADLVFEEPENSHFVIENFGKTPEASYAGVSNELIALATR